MVYMKLVGIFNWGVLESHDLPDGWGVEVRGRWVNSAAMIPIAAAMLLFLGVFWPMLLHLQCQICAAVLGLKEEAEIGSKLVEGHAVRVRNVSCCTGSVNLSDVLNKADDKAGHSGGKGAPGVKYPKSSSSGHKDEEAPPATDI